MKAWMKIALGGLCLEFLMIGLVAFVNIMEMPMIFQMAAGVVTVLLILWLVKTGKELHTERKARKKEIMEQRIRQTAESAHFLEEPSPDSILYLRPFKVDEKYMSEVEYAGKLYNSFESLICRMVTDSGNPVAIGRPGEELQPLGAQRIYATDDTWQAKVTEYFNESKCVILYADFTPGVKWEIENAVAKYRDKLILIPKVYNQRETAVDQFSRIDITYLSDIYYSLWVNHFLFKKAHRGRWYYHSWNQLLKKYMPKIKMDDRVSAVIFENGKAVPFYSAKPNQEEQFHAIHRAINAKLGIQTQPDIYLKKGEKPYLKVCADLGMRNTHATPWYPTANGFVEFYEQGLRYKSWIRFFHFNKDLARQFSAIKHYRKKELIPYASIREVRQVKEHCLRLILEETNGSMYLSVPGCHREYIPYIKEQLELCCQNNTFPAEENTVLKQAFARQSADYTKAFFAIEAISLVLGMFLFGLALFDSYLALFTLLVFGEVWNISMAVIGGMLSWCSGKKGIRFLGILAAVMHICLVTFFWG